MEVSALPIAEFGSNGGHIAGIADAEACLVRETDGKVQRAIIDGVGDEVHISIFRRSFGVIGAMVFSAITSDAFWGVSSSALALLPNVLPLGQPLSAGEYCR